MLRIRKVYPGSERFIQDPIYTSRIPGQNGTGSRIRNKKFRQNTVWWGEGVYRATEGGGRVREEFSPAKGKQSTHQSQHWNPSASVDSYSPKLSPFLSEESPVLPPIRDDFSSFHRSTIHASPSQSSPAVGGGGDWELGKTGYGKYGGVGGYTELQVGRRAYQR